MKKYILPFLPLGFFFLTTCGSAAQVPVRVENIEAIQARTEAKDALAEISPVPITLYYETTANLGMYEPEQGCYLGSYVLSNRQIDFDMAMFDEMSGKRHAVSVYNLRAGNAYPSSWVINCVALMKTPYIIIKPQNTYNPFDRTTITKMAQAFGEYNIPTFVEFYSNPEDITPDFDEYISFFRFAREEFRKYAPGVAFVWAADADCVGDMRYYPGDDATDWVGLRIWQNIDGGGYPRDAFAAIEYFYYTFQTRKPVAISALAISHYSSADHMYRNQIAVNEIENIYDGIANDFPRIKMINYLDYNEPVAIGAEVSFNYTVTENDTVLDAYKKVIAGDYYLSGLETSKNESAPLYARSPFTAYRTGETVFAHELSFEYDLSTKGYAGAAEIQGMKYYDIGIYAKNSKMTLKVDDDTDRAYLTRQE
jgi:hypothetical protein